MVPRVAGLMEVSRTGVRITMRTKLGLLQQRKANFRLTFPSTECGPELNDLGQRTLMPRTARGRAARPRLPTIDLHVAQLSIRLWELVVLEVATNLVPYLNCSVHNQSSFRQVSVL